MAFESKFFLALMEEDNEQRALFRVRPLLHEQGAFLQEELDELGDEGYLRIVPDKQEQHSFKERMRSLGSLCLVDLRHYEPEVNKIRQNKNYAPQRGELNRFVLYSDAVLALPGEGFYEVVSDPKASPPLTAFYYLRHGGRIKGPYARENDQPEDTLKILGPDSDRLFALALPGQRDRLLYWPIAENKAEAAPKAEEKPAEPLSALERIRLLAAENPPRLAAAAEAPPAVPAEAPAPGGRLRGTPLKRSVLRQRSAARPMPSGGSAAKDKLLSAQLHGLEAERLAMLVELDRLKADKAALLKEALQQQGKEKQAAREQEAQLQQRVAALREELAALLRAQPPAAALTSEPAVPQTIDLTAKLIREALSKAGFVLVKDDAMQLLLLLLQQPMLRLQAPYLADAMLAAHAVASALGIRRPAKGGQRLEAGDALAFVYGEALEGPSTLPQLLCAGLLNTAFTEQERGALQPMPELNLVPGDGFHLAELPVGRPVQLAALKQALQSASRELPEEAMRLLTALEQALIQQGRALPLSLKHSLMRFLCAAQGLMEGGLPAALDRAVLSFVLPVVRLHGLDGAALRPLLEGLPLCLAAL